MIEVAWNNDNRNNEPDTYIANWNTNKGRLSAFLAGWTDWVNNNRHAQDVLHWRTVGAQYASAFGNTNTAGEIEGVVRYELYHVALTAYVTSQRCAHWKPEQREEALRLSWEEVERRGGRMLP